jgi:polysaccharide pyruvyl transferase WcaK-like protein
LYPGSKLKTYLYGSYGHQNGGDDAFVEVVLREHAKYCRPSDFIAQSHAPLRTSQGIIKSTTTKKYFKGQHVIQHYLNTLNLDRVLYAGGGIHTFSEDLLAQRKVLERNPKAICAAVGVSVGPFKEQASIDECKRFLEKFSFVGVRGEASYDRLRRMDAQVQYELTFDIAVLMKDVLDISCASTSRKEKSVGVSMLTQAHTYHPTWGKDELLKADEQRLDLVALMLNNLIREKSCDSIHLIDFCSHALYTDYDILERLKAKLLTDVPVFHEPYGNDPIELFKRVSGMGCMIAMRLHAAVFAYTSGVPCLILPYQNKNQEWAEQIGLPKDDLLDFVSGDAQAYTERLQVLLASGCVNAALPLDDAIRAARRNWESLEKTGF